MLRSTLSKIVLFGLASFIVIISCGSYFAIKQAPKLIKSKAEAYIESIGYHLSLDEVEIHPLTLSASIKKVGLQDDSSKALLSADELSIQVGLAGIFEKHIAIEAIEIKKANIQATKDTDTWNWQKFIKAIKDSKKKKSKQSSFDIVINHIRVIDSSVHVSDQVAQYSIDISPIDFYIKHLGTIKPGGKIQVSQEDDPISLGEFNFDIANHKFHTSDVEINLESLKFALKNVSLIQSGKNKPLLTSEHAELQLAADGLLKKHIHVKHLSILEPELSLEKVDKKWNLLEFINAAKDRFKSPRPSKNPLELLIDDIKVANLKLTLTDHRDPHGYTASIHNMNVEMKDVTNLPQTSLFSRYQIITSPLVWQSHSSGKSINLGSIKAQGQWSRHPNKDIQFGFNGFLDKGSASIKGTWNKNTKESSLNLQLKELSLLPVFELLPASIPLIAKNGSISTDLSIQTTPLGFIASGNLQFGPSIIYEPNHDSELISWKSANFNKLNLQTSSDKSVVAIDEIQLNSPTGRMIFFEDRSSNFKRIFSKPKGETKKEKRPLDLDVRNIILNNGEVDFTDYSIKPFFQTRITDLRGSLTGFSNRPDQVAGLALNGTIDRTGEMIAKGNVAFEDPRRNNDLSVQFIRIPLKAVNPYSKSFAGYEILDGALSLSLNYKTQNANLDGSNQITINQIKLGDPVPGYTGKLKNIPVKRALSFLEDDNGVINLDIPITGNIDHPHFDAHALVWAAISSAIHNAWNSPTRISQRVLGLDDFEGLYFEAGESTLRNKEKEKIISLIKALQEKPGTILVLHGSYDENSDQQQLKQLTLNRQIFELAGFKAPPGAPLPNLSLSDSRIRNIIQSLYTKALGNSQWNEMNAAIKTDPKEWESAYKQLLGTIAIDKNALELLATARGNALKKAFLEINPSVGPQIQIGPIKITQLNKLGVLQEISLGN